MMVYYPPEVLNSREYGFPKCGKKVSIREQGIVEDGASKTFGNSRLKGQKSFFSSGGYRIPAEFPGHGKRKFVMDICLLFTGKTENQDRPRFQDSSEIGVFLGFH